MKNKNTKVDLKNHYWSNRPSSPRSVAVRGIGADHTLYSAPYPAQKLCGMTECASLGFTLIELLVVVLIIGILSAVALPQYQKAVMKARFAQYLTTVNGLKREAQLAFLEQAFPANGDDDLDICKNFESFTGGEWNGDDYITKHWDYQLGTCYNNNVFMTAYFGSGNFSVETGFERSGRIYFSVITEGNSSSCKAMCDTLTSNYGTDSVNSCDCD